MYKLFLSPSTQPFNLYATKGNEQEYMNKIADAMEPLLTKNGIEYDRNKINTSVGVSIADSNAGLYDLHLALHSNASPESLSGKLKGVDIYYFIDSYYGKAAAKIIVENLKSVYPDQNLVKAVPTTKLSELTKTNAPAVLAELGYHDNLQDEQWIKDNVETIAESLTKSVCEYFGLSYIE
ncbi:MAG: N-acetylmuramoyl-L-alanine amidase [Clostridia bacterium]